MIETSSLNLPPTLRSRLQSAGFRFLEDLAGVGPVALARDANISHEDALHILKLTPGHQGMGELNAGAAIAGAKSAWEILSEERNQKRITTFCQEVDVILGGGISPKEVTEICGVPGVGKTQLSMQLVINVQMPPDFGGLGGQAIYIDTEGSFMVERVLEMADAWLADLRYLASLHTREELEQQLAATTADDILANIFYFRIYDYTEQIALVNVLGNFIEEHPRVKLIVIDSVTFHFRQDFADMALRTRLLSTMSQKLMSYADKKELAVVLVNQVTTKVSGEDSKLVPALGETWSHACTNRVILFWTEGQRQCHLYKSPALKAATAPYFVTSRGIRGSPEKLKRQRSWDNKDEEEQ